MIASGTLHHRDDTATWTKLLIHCCDQCEAYCCKSLYFSKISGFPYDKKENEPCRYLTTTNACSIHSELCNRSLSGCLAYECLGAGNIIAQHSTSNKSFELVSQAFVKLHQLQQMFAYLLEASNVTRNEYVRCQIEQKIQELIKLHEKSLEELAAIPLDEYYQKVNPLLKTVWLETVGVYQTMKQQKQEILAKDFSMQQLIQYDFSNKCLRGCCFLGADVRDTNVCDSDLRDTLYISQMQLNTMKGNARTLLPPHLHIPTHW